jgi:hypothetical protein
VAEQLILVCDVCGKPAAETVTIRAGGKSLLKDLCPDHVTELLNGTRAAKRGRPRSTAPAPSRKASQAKRASARRRGSRAGTASTASNRRGRAATRVLCRERAELGE